MLVSVLLLLQLLSLLPLLLLLQLRWPPRTCACCAAFRGLDALLTLTHDEDNAKLLVACKGPEEGKGGMDAVLGAMATSMDNPQTLKVTSVIRSKYSSVSSILLPYSTHKLRVILLLVLLLRLSVTVII